MSEQPGNPAGHVTESVAAQLEAADGGKEAPSSAAPGPDAMSRVIEEHAQATAAEDPDNLADGQEQ